MMGKRSATASEKDNFPGTIYLYNYKLIEYFLAVYLNKIGIFLLKI